MFHRFYYWLISPAELEDISGIKGAYAERLRHAGVKSSAELFRRIRKRSDLQDLAQETGLDQELLLSAVARARKRWFQNYKVTGLLAIFFGFVGIVGTVITFDSWKEAKQFGAEERQRLVDMERRNGESTTAVWALHIEMELVGLPANLFSAYQAEDSKQGQLLRGKAPTAPEFKRHLDSLNLLKTKYFFEAWSSITSREGEWFPGILMLQLSSSPPIQVGLPPCPSWFSKFASLPSRLRDDSDLRRPRACRPGIFLNTVSHTSIKPHNSEWIQMSGSFLNDWPVRMGSNVVAGRGVDKVNFMIEFGPDEIKQLSAAIGPFNVATLRDTPDLIFLVPVTKQHNVRKAKTISVEPYLPQEIRDRYAAVLPRTINIMIAVNGGHTFRKYYSFGRDNGPTDDAADAISFTYAIRKSRDAPINGVGRENTPP